MPRRLLSAFVVTLAALAAGLFLAPLVRGQEGDPTPQFIAAGAEFHGLVTIDGSPAPDGTVIEALVGETVCGTTTTLDGTYAIGVNAGSGQGNQFQEGCGSTDNGRVTFRTGEHVAAEIGFFVGHGAQELNLSFGQRIILPDTGTGQSAQEQPTALLALATLFALGGCCALALFLRLRRSEP